MEMDLEYSDGEFGWFHMWGDGLALGQYVSAHCVAEWWPQKEFLCCKAQSILHLGEAGSW
jgi:hypothetical protein